MSVMLECPACNAKALDLCKYESMMVIKRGLALFSLSCPTCGSAISAIQPIPHELRDEIEFAAIRLNAGMGQDRQA